MPQDTDTTPPSDAHPQTAPSHSRRTHEGARHIYVVRVDAVLRALGLAEPAGPSTERPEPTGWDEAEVIELAARARGRAS